VAGCLETQCSYLLFLCFSPSRDVAQLLIPQQSAALGRGSNAGYRDNKVLRRTLPSWWRIFPWQQGGSVDHIARLSKPLKRARQRRAEVGSTHATGRALKR
jgi:hypothetical protein